MVNWPYRAVRIRTHGAIESGNAGVTPSPRESWPLAVPDHNRKTTTETRGKAEGKSDALFVVGERQAAGRRLKAPRCGQRVPQPGEDEEKPILGSGDLVDRPGHDGKTLRDCDSDLTGRRASRAGHEDRPQEEGARARAIRAATSGSMRRRRRER
jgi:hypothetical protein